MLLEKGKESEPPRVVGVGDCMNSMEDCIDGIKGLLLLCLLGSLVYWCFTMLDYGDFVEKREAITLEQSRKNVNIAEDLVEKEFKQDKKYFRLKSVSGNSKVYLHENTGYSWANKHLEAELELGKEKYILYFHTQKVKITDEKIDIYEPVGVSKVLKEQEE